MPRGKPKNPLNGAPFLETLAECVADPLCLCGGPYLNMVSTGERLLIKSLVCAADRCVEDPVGYEDECKDVRLRVVRHRLATASCHLVPSSHPII